MAKNAFENELTVSFGKIERASNDDDRTLFGKASDQSVADHGRSLVRDPLNTIAPIPLHRTKLRLAKFVAGPVVPLPSRLDPIPESVERRQKDKRQHSAADRATD